MIGWTTIAPVIKSLFGQLAQDLSLVVEPVDGEGGSRAFAAEWHEGQRGAIHDRQQFSLLLKVTSIASIGSDEVRYEEVDGSVSDVTQTGGGNPITITGEPEVSDDGLITISQQGPLGTGRFDWSYGGESETGVLLPVDGTYELGTTGLTANFVVGPHFLNTTYEWTGTAAALQATVCGHRRLTLQVQAHAIQHTDSVWGMAALERLRAGLRRPSSIAALQAFGVAIIQTERAVALHYKDVGRVVSAASMDVILGIVFNDVDPVPMGWIEGVTLTSRIKDPDGVALPGSLQMVDEVLPEGFTPP